MKPSNKKNHPGGWRSKKTNDVGRGCVYCCLRLKMRDERRAQMTFFIAANGASNLICADHGVRSHYAALFALYKDRTISRASGDLIKFRFFQFPGLLWFFIVHWYASFVILASNVFIPQLIRFVTRSGKFSVSGRAVVGRPIASERAFPGRSVRVEGY